VFHAGKGDQTSAKDAMEDLRLFKVIFDQYEGQQAQP